VNYVGGCLRNSDHLLHSMNSHLQKMGSTEAMGVLAVSSKGNQCSDGFLVSQLSQVDNDDYIAK
jgi:hypothetical protein